MPLNVFEIQGNYSKITKTFLYYFFFIISKIKEFQRNFNFTSYNQNILFREHMIYSVLVVPRVTLRSETCTFSDFYLTASHFEVNSKYYRVN